MAIQLRSVAHVISSSGGDIVAVIDARWTPRETRALILTNSDPGEQVASSCGARLFGAVQKKKKTEVRREALPADSSR